MILGISGGVNGVDQLRLVRSFLVLRNRSERLRDICHEIHEVNRYYEPYDESNEFWGHIFFFLCLGFFFSERGARSTSQRGKIDLNIFRKPSG